MRVKQTARKSTGPRQNPDPLTRRMGNILETKRNSAGSAGSAYIKMQSQSGSRYSLPSTSEGSGLGRGGKQVSMFRNRDQDVKIPRKRSGQLALSEIRALQKTWNLLVPRAPFHRLVREITQTIEAEKDIEEPGFKYQVAALQALQEAAEAYLITLFEDAYLCTIHAKRVTLFASDMQLCRRLRHD